MRRGWWIFLVTVFMAQSALAADTAKTDKAATAATSATASSVAAGPRYRAQLEIYYQWKGLSEQQLREVMFRSLVAEGETRETAEAAINSQFVQTQQDALDVCRNQHESQSNCLREKVGQMKGQLRDADFNTRNSITAAAMADCKRQMGRCAGVRKGELSIIDLRPVVAAAASHETASVGVSSSKAVAVPVAEDPAKKGEPEEPGAPFGLN